MMSLGMFVEASKHLSFAVTCSKDVCSLVTIANCLLFMISATVTIGPMATPRADKLTSPCSDRKRLAWLM